MRYFLLILALTALPSVTAQSVSTSGRCGSLFGGRICTGSSFGNCCSQYSYCGSTPGHCGTGCDPKYGTCSNSAASSSKIVVRSSSTPAVGRSSSTPARGLSTSIRSSSTPVRSSATPVRSSSTRTSPSASPSAAQKVSTDGRCGNSYGATGGQTCIGSRYGDCCSLLSFCGSTDAFCTVACQANYGRCMSSAQSSSSRLISRSSSIVSSSSRTSASSTFDTRVSLAVTSSSSTLVAQTITSSLTSLSSSTFSSIVESSSSSFSDYQSSSATSSLVSSSLASSSATTSAESSSSVVSTTDAPLSSSSLEPSTSSTSSACAPTNSIDARFNPSFDTGSFSPWVARISTATISSTYAVLDASQAPFAPNAGPYALFNTISETGGSTGNVNFELEGIPFVNGARYYCSARIRLESSNPEIPARYEFRLYVSRRTTPAGGSAGVFSGSTTNGEWITIGGVTTIPNVDATQVVIVNILRRAGALGGTTTTIGIDNVVCYPLDGSQCGLT